MFVGTQQGGVAHARVRSRKLGGLRRPTPVWRGPTRDPTRAPTQSPSAHPPSTHECGASERLQGQSPDGWPARETKAGRGVSASRCGGVASREPVQRWLVLQRTKSGSNDESTQQSVLDERRVAWSWLWAEDQEGPQHQQGLPPQVVGLEHVLVDGRAEEVDDGHDARPNELWSRAVRSTSTL